MTRSQTFTRRLGIRHPVIQAPMAVIGTPELAAAVSNAGGLGSLALGHLTVAQAAEQIRKTRVLTTAPFSVNFFCHQPPKRSDEQDIAWLQFLAQKTGVPRAALPEQLREIYDTAYANAPLLDMLLAERPALVSFHFGVPEVAAIKALRDAGIVTMATATSLAEAQQIEAAGIDMLCAQGYEAGGHRGIFDPAEDLKLSTFALTRLLVSKCNLPVIAAGGIMDGAGIAAVINLGAAGAQLGTAFIACPESSASAAYRAQLLGAGAYNTAVTANISGRPARGMVNRMYFSAHAGKVPDYPVAYDAAKVLNQWANAQGNYDYAAHWAGQGAPLAREMPAAQLLDVLVEEWQRASSAAGQ
ncbi:NAD(P)H-dependent flavin oxidoreductase [Amantichitinum ursilacus]|uniref:Nitronate monooxygenase n=1 Tax=Amantichitinum ursilacus TaxID=857265 RepID=A0A0N0XI93_9NEIS|nr:nitronate monooxygenase [Amantichitinum ursilacus]KPC52516.1 Nitronate monooxygenase [Amantichitinum ursilacus]